ncbi:hypothetical protein [Amycolatopsis regifaucium]|uniref:hypothetical protein n=1 Tax=Amycolatopsis regifaucium TaxID=546365 RepID=UPI0012E94153|nr:hypothetical protein [Amycolatopsis regifaucium]
MRARAAMAVRAAASRAPGSFAGIFAGWPLFGRRPAGLCTVWQVAVGYFVRRLPGGVT